MNGSDSSPVVSRQNSGNTSAAGGSQRPHPHHPPRSHFSTSSSGSAASSSAALYLPNSFGGGAHASTSLYASPSPSKYMSAAASPKSATSRLFLSCARSDMSLSLSLSLFLSVSSSLLHRSSCTTLHTPAHAHALTESEIHSRIVSCGCEGKFFEHFFFLIVQHSSGRNERQNSSCGVCSDSWRGAT